MELEVLESMELEVLELQDVINNVDEIELIEEIIIKIEEIMIAMNDITDVVILIFGFLVGYIVVRDFINNIFKSV